MRKREAGFSRVVFCSARGAAPPPAFAGSAEAWTHALRTRGESHIHARSLLQGTMSTLFIPNYIHFPLYAQESAVDDAARAVKHNTRDCH